MAGRKNWLRTRWNRANLCANLLERLRESLGCEKCRFDPMLLTLDSNAFWVTKCTKENHCQGSCMGKVFLCFLFFVFDLYFSGSKAHSGASPNRFFLCTF